MTENVKLPLSPDGRYLLDPALLAADTAETLLEEAEQVPSYEEMINDVDVLFAMFKDVYADMGVLRQEHQSLRVSYEWLVIGNAVLAIVVALILVFGTK